MITTAFGYGSLPVSLQPCDGTIEADTGTAVASQVTGTPSVTVCSVPLMYWVITIWSVGVETAHRVARGVAYLTAEA